MKLIQEYLKKAILLSQESLDDYGSKIRVTKHNRRADRLRKIAVLIEQKHPESKNDFYQLLFHENETVKQWSAHHLLEVMNYDKEYRATALKIIAHVARTDNGPEGFGNQIWLKDWLSTHPEDKCLLSTHPEDKCL